MLPTSLFKWTAIALVTLGVGAASTHQAAAQDVPVIIGQDGPGYDACGSSGRVVNLNPDGDNYLSVRARPSVNGAELDRLGPGFVVSMCSQNGRWIGIVYAPNGQGSCGVGTPVPSPRPYEGNCRSGWVFNKYIELFAG
ncbi:MAG: integron [Pseudomonadota bacterium]